MSAGCLRSGGFFSQMLTTTTHAVNKENAMTSAQTLSVFYRTDKMLTVEPVGTLFYIDGRPGRFTSEISRSIVQMVIQQSPKATSCDQLRTRLGERQFPRYVSMARGDFKSAGLDIDVLASVRTTGYRLADGWSRQESQRPGLVQAMNELATLVTNAIEFVNASKLEKNRIGLMQVERTDYRALVSGQNFIRFDQAISKVIDELSSMGLGSQFMRDIVKVKQSLVELATYLLFWRTGDRITDTDWKINFREESRSLLDSIMYDVERLGASASGRASPT